LFTGVMACGLICWLSAWTDSRFLPKGLQIGNTLRVLNLSAGAIFLALGIKGYWDHSGPTALLILLATLALGWIAAQVWQRIGNRTGTSS
jgi:hypothetical protein